jgi:hypothetical protein
MGEVARGDGGVAYLHKAGFDDSGHSRVDVHLSGVGFAIEVELYAMCPRGYWHILAAILKRRGRAEVAAVNIQLGMLWQNIQIQQRCHAWRLHWRVVDAPAGGGIDGMVHVPLDHRAVWPMHVSVMSVRIDDRVADRAA